MQFLASNFNTKLLQEICSSAECCVLKKSAIHLIFAMSEVQYLQSQSLEIRVSCTHPLILPPLVLSALQQLQFLSAPLLCFSGDVYSLHEQDFLPRNVELGKEVEPWINRKFVNGRAQTKAVSNQIACSQIGKLWMFKCLSCLMVNLAKCA